MARRSKASHTTHKQPTPKQPPAAAHGQRAPKSAAPPPGGRKGSEPAAPGPVEVLESFEGTARYVLGYYMGGASPGVLKNESRVLRSAGELEKFCDSIQTHGYERVKGPAGRVEVGSKLKDAAAAWKHDWQETCVIVATARGHSVQIVGVEREAGGGVVVRCEKRARQMESQTGGFGAVVVRGVAPEGCDVQFE